MSTEKLRDLLIPVFAAAQVPGAERLETDRQWAMPLVASLKERMRLLPDAITVGRFYFVDPTEYEPKGVRKHFSRPGVDGDLMMLSTEFSNIPDDEFTKDTAEETLRRLAEEFGRKPAELIHPLRLALSGMTTGPGLFDIVFLLGKETCARRIAKAAQFARSYDPAKAEQD
jgi:glutamyl-tRNA synthetase